MREPASAGASIVGDACARCHAEAVLFVRNEHFCSDCFLKYVGSKVLKRLESGKIRNGYNQPEKKVLVPTTLDLSSLCLLHMLHQQRRNRLEKNQHTGYFVQILYIDISVVEGQELEEDIVSQLSSKFPDHVISCARLEDIFSYDLDIKGDLPTKSTAGLQDDHSTSRERLKRLLNSTFSLTSKADLIDVLNRRLAYTYAARNACDSILLSDSTTKLAEKILSATAKGRGGTLPWLTANHFSADGLPVFYPMQDVLQKELVLYAQAIDPPLLPRANQADGSRGNNLSQELSIDGLVGQYFASVEENYPSIVANVVKTSNKLISDSYDEPMQHCQLCQLPFFIQGTDQEPSVSTVCQSVENDMEILAFNKLCLGCKRTLSGK